MSVSEISGSSALLTLIAQGGNQQSGQNKFQKIQSEFQQLGQDLQSGNLTQVQSDFAILSKQFPVGGQRSGTPAGSPNGSSNSGVTQTSRGNSSENNGTIPTNTLAPTIAVSTAAQNSPLAQAFQQLGQDLQTGNLTAAQQDFATIEQDAQQQGSAVAQHHHRHHGGGGGQFGQEINTLQRDFGTLGQALQSGNVASAQQAYATFQSALQQDFPGVASSLESGSTSSAATSNTVNVTA